MFELGMDLRIPLGSDPSAVTTAPLFYSPDPDPTPLRYHRYEPSVTIAGHFGIRLQFDSIRLPTLR